MPEVEATSEALPGDGTPAVDGIPAVGNARLVNVATRPPPPVSLPGAAVELPPSWTTPVEPSALFAPPPVLNGMVAVSAPAGPDVPAVLVPSIPPT